MSDFTAVLALLLFGALEGAGFYLSGAYDPRVMLDQMKFRRFVVLKLFLSALGTSMLVQSVFASIAPKRFESTREYRKKQAGFLRVVAGCAMLGAGMTLAGSGPSMLPSQLTTVGTGMMILAGSVVGGLLFALLEASNFCPVVAPLREAHELDTKAKLPYVTIAAPLGAALCLAADMIDQMVPHAEDIAGLGLQPSWSPLLAGFIIGLNQIPLRLIAGHGQGASRSIQSVISFVSGGRLSPKTRVTSIASIYQLIYIFGGTFIGAVYCFRQEPSAVVVDGFPLLRTFVGALLMQFGSRFAQGCTCGHGISGMAELSVESFAGGATIFGAGMLTALFL